MLVEGLSRECLEDVDTRQIAVPIQKLVRPFDPLLLNLPTRQHIAPPKQPVAQDEDQML